MQAIKLGEIQQALVYNRRLQPNNVISTSILLEFVLSFGKMISKIHFRPSMPRLFCHQQRNTTIVRSAIAMPVRCDFAEGARVRVKSSVKVYHVGKFRDGLDLQGMEGAVLEDVRNFKGTELSANLPWKVQFEAKDGDGKAVKVIAHLVCSRF